MIALHLAVCWIWIGLGVIAGAVLGLFFHKEDWQGGYSSFRRRMLRLGHIAFFGLAFLNLAFALTVKELPAIPDSLTVGSLGLLVGAVGMPTCCFLSAWRKPFRHTFPIPVIGVTVAVVSMLSALAG